MRSVCQPLAALYCTIGSIARLEVKLATGSAGSTNRKQVNVVDGPDCTCCHCLVTYPSGVDDTHGAGHCVFVCFWSLFHEVPAPTSRVSAECVNREASEDCLTLGPQWLGWSSVIYSMHVTTASRLQPDSILSHRCTLGLPSGPPWL